MEYQKFLISKLDQYERNRGFYHVFGKNTEKSFWEISEMVLWDFKREIQNIIINNKKQMRTYKLNLLMESYSDYIKPINEQLFLERCDKLINYIQNQSEQILNIAELYNQRGGMYYNNNINLNLLKSFILDVKQIETIDFLKHKYITKFINFYKSAYPHEKSILSYERQMKKYVFYVRKKELDEIYKKELEKLNKGRTEQVENIQINKVKFHGKPTEFIELVKGLIENGNLKGTQKEIIQDLSTYFEIEIKNPDKLISDIKKRNNGSETLFLDKLKVSLQNYIINTNEKKITR